MPDRPLPFLSMCPQFAQATSGSKIRRVTHSKENNQPVAITQPPVALATEAQDARAMEVAMPQGKEAAPLVRQRSLKGPSPGKSVMARPAVSSKQSAAPLPLTSAHGTPSASTAKTSTIAPISAAALEPSIVDVPMPTTSQSRRSSGRGKPAQPVPTASHTDTDHAAKNDATLLTASESASKLPPPAAHASSSLDTLPPMKRAAVSSTQPVERPANQKAGSALPPAAVATGVATETATAKGLPQESMRAFVIVSSLCMPVLSTELTVATRVSVRIFLSGSRDCQ